MTGHPLIRAMGVDDWRAVRDIFEAGIATGNATFETSARPWHRWDDSHLPDHRLVATDHAGEIVGTRQRIGQLNGVWRDTLFLERRSAVVG